MLRLNKPLRHKFNAKASVKDGIRFASLAEGRFYDNLKLLQQAGEVLFFLRQVPFHLPGNVRYVVDFVVFGADGSIKFIDVKGMITKEFAMKKKMVEALYPIEIELVK